MTARPAEGLYIKLIKQPVLFMHCTWHGIFQVDRPLPNRVRNRRYRGSPNTGKSIHDSASNDQAQGERDGILLDDVCPALCFGRPCFRVRAVTISISLDDSLLTLASELVPGKHKVSESNIKKSFWPLTQA